jgi:CheY-like chemotaxis protein/predicted RNA-binding Zn-ribbon protein involved in translation (DUF1610 family)
MNKKPKILIVDDDEDVREMYVAVFEKNGFKVLEAKDGLDGLEVVNKEIPDIIFTGIIMPRMDGFTMMDALKKNVATASIPVVISSHLGRESDREKANRHGAKDFIIRGFTTPNQVVRRVDLILAKGGNYHLKFDPHTEEAKLLANDFEIADDFQCSKCKETMILDLRPQDKTEMVFDARFVCPKCGWIAK